MPVAVLQPQRLTQTEPRLGKKSPQQPVAHRAPPLPRGRIPLRARSADPINLPGRQRRRRRPPRLSNPDHRPAATPTPGDVLKQRFVAAVAAVDNPIQLAADIDAVELLVGVAREHSPQPHRDGRLGKPGPPRRDRHHVGSVPGTQPTQEPAEILQSHRAPVPIELRQVLPPQRQRPRVGLHRVRRVPLHPKVFQILLGRRDRKMVPTHHGPRPLPVGQHQSL
ncbi:hypothetical protein R1CP_36225 (plasmid) [Rhodococcus opacus]|uniref:Uncharacterized protein n=1 Tax=Rhodococcus opacus TaxID=37919 RepID=A0A1B1KGW5_RHOOP|nr:hypothetical protein R1CP_36225 [Rhodococcus opacus]